MIDKLTHTIGMKIKKNYPEANIEILKYSLNVIINPLATIILSMVISHFTNDTYDVVIAMVSFAVLRAFSGGIHIKSSELCIIISTTLFIGISFLHDYLVDYTLILTIVSSLLTLTFAPSRIYGQTRIPEQFYPILKVVSLGIISINYIFNSSVLALTFFIQSMLLINIGKGGENK
jgi:accessory gene regulator B